jgi:hypothetical protein
MKRFIVLALLLSGCASVKLASPDVRTKTYSIETSLDKDAAFSKLLAWSARQDGDLRLQDRPSGQITLAHQVPCDVLKLGNGFAQEQKLAFKLQIEAGKPTTLRFIDLIADAYGGAYDSRSRPSTQAEVDLAAKECLEPIKLSIEQELK